MSYISGDMTQNTKGLVTIPPIGQHVPYQVSAVLQALLTSSPKGFTDNIVLATVRLLCRENNNNGKIK